MRAAPPFEQCRKRKRIALRKSRRPKVRRIASWHYSAQYERAPAVTRERLYLETIENVLASSKKVVLDTQNGSGNLIYLPIDKLLEQSPSRAPHHRDGTQRDCRKPRDQ